MHDEHVCRARACHMACTASSISIGMIGADAQMLCPASLPCLGHGHIGRYLVAGWVRPATFPGEYDSPPRPAAVLEPGTSAMWQYKLYKAGIISLVKTREENRLSSTLGKRMSVRKIKARMNMVRTFVGLPGAVGRKAVSPRPLAQEWADQLPSACR